MGLDVRIPMLAVLAAGAMLVSSYVSDLSAPAARTVSPVVPAHPAEPVKPRDEKLIAGAQELDDGFEFVATIPRRSRNFL